MSSQWNSDGYYYPTQIAQYGLSHYSKYIVDRRRLETGPPSSKPWTRVSAAGDEVPSPAISDDGWRQLKTNGFLRRVFDATTQRNVYRFQTPGVLGDVFLLVRGFILMHS